MLFRLIGKGFIESAREMSYHLVPERYNNAPADLQDTRSTRNLAADGSLLNYSVSEADLLSSPNIIAEVFAIVSLLLVILASGSGLSLLPLAVIPAMLMGTAGFKSKKSTSKPMEFIGFLLVMVSIGVGFYYYNTLGSDSILVGVAVFMIGVLALMAIPSNGPALQNISKGSLLTGGLAIYFGGFFSFLFAGYALFRVFEKWSGDEQERNAVLSASAGRFNADVSADAVPAIAEAEAERLDQNSRALTDKTTFFPFAVATGLLSQKGDVYAAERGQVIGITENDLTTHLFIFGETGTGKTATTLRPVYKKWKDSCIGGALILDGKGDLPTEFAQGNSNFFLLDPMDPKCVVNLIHGLGADEIASVITQVMSDPKQDQFWVGSAETLIKYCALCLQFAREKLMDPAESDYFAWNLSNLSKMVSSIEFRTQVLDRCSSDLETATPLVQTAHRYLSTEFITMSNDTRSGIIQTASQLMDPIASHEQIYRWSSTTSDGFDIEAVLTGLHVGIAAPEYKYGKSGLAVQSLMKARIYRAIRQRGSKWSETEGQKKVLMMMDECQELLGPQDNIFAVARSLGLTAICATQTIEGLNAVLTKDNAAALLGNFRNLICFKSSPDTFRYISERMGAAALRVEHENTGLAYEKVLAVVDAGGAVQGVDSGRKQTEGGVAASYQLQVKNVVSPEDLSFMLSPRFSAAVLFNRANTTRRSIGYFEIGGVE